MSAPADVLTPRFDSVTGNADAPSLLTQQADPINSLFGFPTGASRRNVVKIIAHYYIDYLAYFTYSPVFSLLQYFRGQDLKIILYMKIAYILAAFVGTVVMAFVENTLKFHQRSMARLVLLTTVLNMLFIVLSTAINSELLAIVSAAVMGYYFSSTVIFTSAVFIECMDPENPEQDYSRQFLAISFAPLTGSAIIMVLFAVLGDEWKPLSMQIVIYAAVSLQLVCFGIVMSISYEHVKPKDEEQEEITQTATPPEEGTGVQSAKWVPWVALINNSCRDIVEQMMWSYFPYYAADKLGLEPQVVFGTILASQGCCVVWVLIEQRVHVKYRPYVKVAWAMQILVPIASWLVYASMDRWPVAVFLTALVIQDSVRESPGGLSNATVLRYATPDQKELFAGLGVEMFRLIGWIVGAVFGGLVGDIQGFEATVLPTAIVATVTWLFALALIFAPKPSDDGSHHLIGAGNLRTLVKLAQARDKACSSVLMAIRFKRTLKRAVERRKRVKESRRQDDIEVYSC
jgi:predicted MFS family arabinose efflux permease